MSEPTISVPSSISPRSAVSVLPLALVLSLLSSSSPQPIASIPIARVAITANSVQSLVFDIFSMLLCRRPDCPSAGGGSRTITI